ncbi:MAG: hypothetical protein HKN56_01915 [Gammaproteobacteria bacterium]|nr:hypothetical protein [Gammaproteobacteria bacterium]NND53707.1 hypothetical protein [Gammaproteobacteria bacterium]
MNRRSNIVKQGSAHTLIIGLAVILVVAFVSGVLMYDFGLSKAGFKSAEAADEIAILRDLNAELQSANKRLSERVAILETAEKVDREAYRQVDSQLAELQSRILAQQEDLEFYRGIIGEDDGSALRIQDFTVSPGLRDQEFELRLVLAQALRSNREISGQVDIALEGLQRSEPAVMRLSELGESAESLKYSFMYFQDLKTLITIPADFEPRRVRVTVRPRSKGAKTVEEFFVWPPQTG